jgi:sporulation protein YlmC with PRC-barrel domain
MLKQHLAACLVGTALATSSAFAQTSSTPPSPGQFITQQSPGQWRASKLVGVDVYGTDNAKVGDVREVLLNRDGAAEAVVIGVGGFLGIGEKDVAVPFKALEWVTEPRTTATSTLPSAAAPEGAPPVSPAPGTTTDTTGSVAQQDSAVIAVSRGYPDRAVLRMTRADLQNAPTFRYASETSATTTAPATRTNPPATPNPPTNAPRQ